MHQSIKEELENQGYMCYADGNGGNIIRYGKDSAPLSDSTISILLADYTVESIVELIKDRVKRWGKGFTFDNIILSHKGDSTVKLKVIDDYTTTYKGTVMLYVMNGSNNECYMIPAARVVETYNFPGGSFLHKKLIMERMPLNG